MKNVLYAAVVVVGCTVAASAQGMAADKMAQDKMEKSMTVAGCVAESGGKFMLNNAMMAGDKMAGDKMAGSPGAASMAHPMSYELTGGTLKPHVGHKVEVTGMMKPMAKDAMGKEGMAKEGMAKEGMAKEGMAKEGMMKKDAMMMGGTIAVTNVKMVAATCS